MEKRYAKRLTPESHYEMVLKAEEYLRSKDVPEMHKKIIKMFAYHRMNTYEISRSGKIIGKRGVMSQDMIWEWIKRYFPDLKYDEKPTKCKRGSDTKHICRMKKAKDKLLAEAPYCVICGSTENLELDHILTVSAGGGDDISNLQLLCHKCHCEKTKQENETFGWSKEGLAKGRNIRKENSLSKQKKKG